MSPSSLLGFTGRGADLSNLIRMAWPRACTSLRVNKRYQPQTTAHRPVSARSN